MGVDLYPTRKVQSSAEEVAEGYSPEYWMEEQGFEDGQGFWTPHWTYTTWRRVAEALKFEGVTSEWVTCGTMRADFVKQVCERWFDDRDSLTAEAFFWDRIKTLHDLALLCEERGIDHIGWC